jgi:hypothetical protein
MEGSTNLKIGIMNPKKKPNPRQAVTKKANSPIPRKEQLKQRMLDHCDLQEMFNVTRGTIYNWCRMGILKVIKIGGKNYFDADDVDALILERKQWLVPRQEQQKKN